MYDNGGGLGRVLSCYQHCWDNHKRTSSTLSRARDNCSTFVLSRTRCHEIQILIRGCIYILFSVLGCVAEGESVVRCGGRC